MRLPGAAVERGLARNLEPPVKDQDLMHRFADFIWAYLHQPRAHSRPPPATSSPYTASERSTGPSHQANDVFQSAGVTRKVQHHSYSFRCHQGAHALDHRLVERRSSRQCMPVVPIPLAGHGQFIGKVVGALDQYHIQMTLSSERRSGARRVLCTFAACGRPAMEAVLIFVAFTPLHHQPVTWGWQLVWMGPAHWRSIQ